MFSESTFNDLTECCRRLSITKGIVIGITDTRNTEAFVSHRCVFVTEIRVLYSEITVILLLRTVENGKYAYKK